ncbi:hypothetical protein BURPS305_6772 [Burkholderia pseudomallei 305]|nr:hypothetical protein BURPS305_6772 [Burkholderia pseudomallei 305]
MVMARCGRSPRAVARAAPSRAADAPGWDARRGARRMRHRASRIAAWVGAAHTGSRTALTNSAAKP